MVQLTDNYRSHQSIVEISSKLFYNGTLVPTYPEGHDSLCNISFLRGQTKNFPILFHSITTGVEEKSDKKSRRSTAEAEIVGYYVKKVTAHGVDDKDIGVVSPYAYQAETIRKIINNPNIVVESVERFQGSERRVIIISTVIAGDDYGFIADALRTNTSITRAKHLLVIVGNRSTLEKIPSWKK